MVTNKDKLQVIMTMQTFTVNNQR